MLAPAALFAGQQYDLDRGPSRWILYCGQIAVVFCTIVYLCITLFCAGDTETVHLLSCDHLPLAFSRPFSLEYDGCS